MQQAPTRDALCNVTLPFENLTYRKQIIKSIFWRRGIVLPGKFSHHSRWVGLVPAPPAYFPAALATLRHLAGAARPLIGRGGRGRVRREGGGATTWGPRGSRAKHLNERVTELGRSDIDNIDWKLRGDWNNKKNHADSRNNSTRIKNNMQVRKKIKTNYNTKWHFVTY